MRKVINPCVCKVFSGKKYKAFAEIVFEDGRLSICGVIGPKSNGNSFGSAGQCVKEIAAGIPTGQWTKEMLEKFCDIWDKWHLNDLHPYCQHMKELGWNEEAGQVVPIYNYKLTHAAMDEKRKAENAALSALRNGQDFHPTDEQVMYATLPYSTKSVGHQLEDQRFYEPEKKMYPGDYGAVKNERRGWIRFDESEEFGILCKPCPICGYKYGTSWLTEKVPQDVIDWLFALPDTEVTPAWV